MFSGWSCTRDRLDISDGSVAEDSFTGVGWLRLSLCGQKEMVGTAGEQG